MPVTVNHSQSVLVIEFLKD